MLTPQQLGEYQTNAASWPLSSLRGQRTQHPLLKGRVCVGSVFRGFNPRSAGSKAGEAAHVTVAGEKRAEWLQGGGGNPVTHSRVSPFSRQASLAAGQP